MFGLIYITLSITGQADTEIWESILVLLTCSIILGGFFYLIEDKWFPIRKKKMLKKVVQIFQAEPLSESQAKFKAGKYDVIIDITFVLRLSQYAPNGEVITFHVPRNQLNDKKLARPLSKIEEQLNNKPTYRIYRTNGMGLKLAKRRIEKRLT
ncbi:MAG: hypothetical protein DWQ02_23365 [Bacteroidetes bacterium]|nr:MAG: hypothetical protein DWQ02_23365 [Bacteroidota bacterium]